MPLLSYFDRLCDSQFDTFFGPPSAVKARRSTPELPSQSVLLELRRALSDRESFSTEDGIVISRIVARLSEIEAITDQKTALTQVSEVAKLLNDQPPRLK